MSFLRTITLALLFSNVWQPTTAITGDVACVPHFCVSARVSDDNNTVTYQMEGLDTVGWMAMYVPMPLKASPATFSGFGGTRRWSSCGPTRTDRRRFRQRYAKFRTEPKLDKNPPFKSCARA
ncbi:hypothetical protein BDV98DRAFT_2892 [Pterulicium gracile]|uniref:Uncharacterized protein n=1 Tax=Pterulicium gracile TaxID=1884261 RepID=A0A5C3QYC4_9AGAR|nr:hypothetical protein BDV98DRAFT_2892 [Pterula gracilis]